MIDDPISAFIVLGMVIVAICLVLLIEWALSKVMKW
jgi:preprotein translocase subunit SecE